jgi:hypothetical protein
MKLTAKITSFQFYTLMFLSRVFAMVTYIAGINEELSTTDEIIASVFTGVFLIISAIPIILFLKNDNESGIIKRASCLSENFSKVLCVFYLIEALYFGIITAVRFGIFTGSVMFPDTNMAFFIFIMLIASSYIAFKGIEAAGRSAVIILIPVLFALIFVFATQSDAFDFLNFTHPFSDKLTDIVSSGFYSASRTGELGFIILLSPYVKKHKGRHVFSWITAVTVLIVVTEIVLAGVLGRFGATQLFSMYSLSVLAEFGFIERLDAIITCIWLLCAALKIAIIIFLCETLFSSLFRKRNRLLFIAISCIIIFASSIPLINNISGFLSLIRSPVTSLLFISGICVIPSVIMICERIKRSRKR